MFQAQGLSCEKGKNFSNVAIIRAVIISNDFSVNPYKRLTLCCNIHFFIHHYFFDTWKHFFNRISSFYFCLFHCKNVFFLLIFVRVIKNCCNCFKESTLKTLNFGESILPVNAIFFYCIYRENSNQTVFFQCICI